MGRLTSILVKELIEDRLRGRDIAGCRSLMVIAFGNVSPGYVKGLKPAIADSHVV